MTDYEVGYKKPPKTGQFKPGQSGNPKGRPKGRKDFKTDLTEELSEKLTISESGKSKKISKQRALIKSLTAKALKGDTRSATLILAAIGRYMGDEQEETDLTPSSNDIEIIDRFKKRLLNELKADQEDKKDV